MASTRSIGGPSLTTVRAPSRSSSSSSPSPISSLSPSPARLAAAAACQSGIWAGTVRSGMGAMTKPRRSETCIAASTVAAASSASRAGQVHDPHRAGDAQSGDHRPVAVADRRGDARPPHRQLFHLGGVAAGADALQAGEQSPAGRPPSTACSAAGRPAARPRRADGRGPAAICRRLPPGEQDLPQRRGVQGVAPPQQGVVARGVASVQVAQVEDAPVAQHGQVGAQAQVCTRRCISSRPARRRSEWFIATPAMVRMRGPRANRPLGRVALDVAPGLEAGQQAGRRAVADSELTGHVADAQPGALLREQLEHAERPVGHQRRARRPGRLLRRPARPPGAPLAPAVEQVPPRADAHRPAPWPRPAVLRPAARAVLRRHPSVSPGNAGAPEDTDVLRAAQGICSSRETAPAAARPAPHRRRAALGRPHRGRPARAACRLRGVGRQNVVRTSACGAHKLADTGHAAAVSYSCSSPPNLSHRTTAVGGAAGWGACTGASTSPPVPGARQWERKFAARSSGRTPPDPVR